MILQAVAPIKIMPKTFIIHDLKYNTYYCGNKSTTGFCRDRSSAYPFYGINEAKAALNALKKSNPHGNAGCIFEER